MKDILIAGGSGLVGDRLTTMFRDRGDNVHILSRGKEKIGRRGEVYHQWDPEKGQIDLDLVHQADVIINLAGASVGGKRWTNAYKKELADSRILSTRTLVKAINATAGNRRRVLINASAVGYYGNSRTGMLKETDAPGHDFLSDLCLLWENEIEKLQDTTCRKVIFRIGIVLSADGGAMVQMMKPIQLFAGAPLGSGDQYVPWIHLDDLCRAFLFAADQEDMAGVYNAAAPNPVTNRVLTEELAHTLHRPLLLPPVPEWTLKLLLGEFAASVTGSLKVSPAKLIEAGFIFDYPEVHGAVVDLLKGIKK